MKNKLLNALSRIVESSNVYDFKTGKQLKDTSVLLDWGKSKLYPISGTSMKILGLKLKITDDNLKNLPANMYMISFIPKGRNNTVMVQLDEVGGKLRRTVAEDKPISQLDKYIEKDLVKDLNAACTKMGMTINIKQKLAPNLSEKIAEMSGNRVEKIAKARKIDMGEFISKVELKHQLQQMGVTVEGNYVRKRDIEKIFAKKSPTPQAIRKIYKDYIQLKNETNKGVKEWKGLTVKIPSLQEMMEFSEFGEYTAKSIKALLKLANLPVLDEEEIYQDKQGVEYTVDQNGNPVRSEKQKRPFVEYILNKLDVLGTRIAKSELPDQLERIASHSSGKFTDYEIEVELNKNGEVYYVIGYDADCGGSSSHFWRLKNKQNANKLVKILDAANKQKTQYQGLFIDPKAIPFA